MRFLHVCVLLAMAPACSSAQVPSAVEAGPASGPGGTVTGRLTFAETQLPARFAVVTLVRKPAAEDLQPDFENNPAAVLALRTAKKPPGKVVTVSGRSGLDGSYSIGEVPPGDYWAIAVMQGYVVPIGMAANAKEARDIDKLTAGLPVVHVEANHVSMADLTLHRGGVIAGRVRFRDGSPVVGMSVRVQPENVEDWVRPIAYMPLQNLMRNRMSIMDAGDGGLARATDDEGRYRLSGLMPGRYRVSTVLHGGGESRMVMIGAMEMSGEPGRRNDTDTNVTVYQPGVMRKSKGKVFEIRGDEQFLDADIEVDLDGLHTVQGKVLAKEDRHVPNYAFLALTEDGEKGFGYPANIEPDGTFRIPYVAPGTYTLTVDGAQDMEEIAPEKWAQRAGSGIDAEEFEPKVLKRYGRIKMAVIVGEHDVVLDDILLVQATGKEAEEDGPK